MKSIQYIIIFFFFSMLAVTLSSCDKEENNPVITPGTSVISMKINGQLWEGNVNFVSGISSGNFTATCRKSNDSKSETFAMTFESVSTSSDNIYNDDTNGAIIFLDQVNNEESWSIGSGASNSSGILKITKTKNANLITQASATFSGSTKDGNGNLVLITEGKITNALAD